MEEICDIRQPVVFNFHNERIIDSCQRKTVLDTYGAFDVKIRNIKEEKWLTITDILNEFHISDTIPKKFKSEESYMENTFQINKYLDISEKYRGVWTPIISNDNYLIFFFHHWYPNGSAQSWLREYFFYFEKQKG